VSLPKIGGKDPNKEPGKESCNIRLTSVKFNPKESNNKSRISPPVNDADNISDVFFFRLGKYMYKMLNTQYMLNRYKGNHWYDVDILINWGSATIEKSDNDGGNYDIQTIQIFIDGTFMG